MEIIQPRSEPRATTSSSPLRLCSAVLAVTLPGAGVAIASSYIYGAMLQPQIPQVKPEPVLLFSGSYLIGFLFALSCVIAREVLLLLFRRLKGRGSAVGEGDLHRLQRWFLATIWKSPKIRRAILAFLYCLILTGGCVLLSLEIRGLVFYCLLMGVMPPVFIGVLLNRGAE